MNLPEEKIATLLNDTYDVHVSVGTVVHYLKKCRLVYSLDQEDLE